jgi:steroid delta-isomerase-like uncharacterized protein
MSLPPGLDDLVDRWEAAWSVRDAAAFRPVCAPDVHYEDPLCGEPLEGPEQIAAHARRLRAAFPDARVERTGERLTDGRYLAAPCKVAGTHRGSSDELPATGRFIVVHVLWYVELDEERRRLWRVRAFYDAYAAAVQLGVLPARGTLGERALLMLRGFGLRSRT